MQTIEVHHPMDMKEKQSLFNFENIHQETKALATHYELQTFSAELATELMGDIISNASAIHELEARLKVLKSRGRLLNGYIGQSPYPPAELYAPVRSSGSVTRSVVR